MSLHFPAVARKQKLTFSKGVKGRNNGLLYIKLKVVVSSLKFAHFLYILFEKGGKGPGPW